ncbi:MAG: M56 family metallopeptidase [Eubacteriales bacterium]|nr:M56 family metallopeptidase [Eubacteriales bacterium]
MTEFFLNIVNMSISASWVVLAVLLLRLLLKKAPKWITVLLWGIVAIRMICPFSIESVMSLIPSAETISPEIMMDRTPKINSGIPIINNIVNPVIGESFAPDPATSANPLQIWIPILSFVWIVGIAGMLLYTTISYFRVNRKIGTAVLLHDNIFQSESVVSPFVLGIIKPKIYLPFKVNDKDMEHVIAHEQAHIRRKDHWWKPFGFLLLALHWFNPLMWLGYALLCKDIEFACDEKVIKELNTEEKADYSQALLNLSVNRRMIAACPLAFGEVGVKDRVKSVLNYKKTAFWIIIVAVIASAVFAVCFLTSPTTTNLNEKMSLFIEEQIIEHHHGKYKSGEFYCTDFKVLGTRKDKGSTTVYMWVLYSEYDDINGEIEDVSGAHIPTVITVKKADSNVQYELVEYWEPRDGSYYAEDIRAKFPWYLHGKALDPEHNIKEQQANCDKKAQEYFSSVSNVGGADGPSEVITTANIAQLKAKYPQFFNVSTDGGLIVYIWQMAENSYKCYLANSNLEAVSDTTFDYDVGATIAEMRAILTTYDIDKKDIVIAPVYNPLSSYYYKIDDAYRARIQELFWKDMESE